MKLPKSVRIMDGDWRVIVKHKDNCGGSFSGVKQEITIEPKTRDKHEVLRHEIAEIILCDMGTFKDFEGGGREFTLHHHFSSYRSCESLGIFLKTYYDTLKRNKLV